MTMALIYTFLITFIIVFISELGDKTQLLVISFSSKSKTKIILIGVAIGTFFSHGLAILFGSKIGSINNEIFHLYLKVFTYISFLLIGIIGFIPKKEGNYRNEKKSNLLKNLSSSINYIFIIALSIVIGELGDKTFLASLGLGFQYPSYKISLVLGSICGMVSSNFLAISFGKFLGNRFNKNLIENLSNIIFIVFGIIGLFSIFIKSF